MVQQKVQQNYNFNYFNYLTTFGTKTVTLKVMNNVVRQ